MTDAWSRPPTLTPPATPTPTATGTGLPAANHDGDAGDEREGFDRTRDLPRVARLATTLDGVEGAIRRLDAGTYGSCQACGTPIGAAALNADPLRTRCDAHT